MSRKNPIRKVVKEQKEYHTIMLEGASRELVAARMLLKQGFMISIPVADDRSIDLLRRSIRFIFGFKLSRLILNMQRILITPPPSMHGKLMHLPPQREQKRRT